MRSSFPRYAPKGCARNRDAWSKGLEVFVKRVMWIWKLVASILPMGLELAETCLCRWKLFVQMALKYLHSPFPCNNKRIACGSRSGSWPSLFFRSLNIYSFLSGRKKTRWNCIKVHLSRGIKWVDSSCWQRGEFCGYNPKLRPALCSRPLPRQLGHIWGVNLWEPWNPWFFLAGMPGVQVVPLARLHTACCVFLLWAGGFLYRKKQPCWNKGIPARGRFHRPAFPWDWNGWEPWGREI